MKKFTFALLFLYTISCLASANIGGINKVTEPAYRMPAGKQFHNAADKELIAWGDSLKTGPKGFMGILFQDGSMVKMAGNTEVMLAEPDGAKGTRKINMKFGDLWAKIVRSDQGLEVRTPSAVASVKGTSFWVMVTPGGDTRLMCQEGIVSFMNAITGAIMDVAGGQMCTAGMDGSMEMTPTNPEPQQQPPQSPESVPPQTPPSSQPPPGGGETQPAPTGGSGGGVGFGMNGAVGATTINDVNYQYFSLRPDISIWKFGIGLDLAFYFDADGNLREEDWDEAQDYVDKIYYLRYGKPGDPLYIRVGNLSPITLGYGLIMRRYTNSIEWPQVRRIGMQAEIRKGAFTFSGLINNFRELETPGLVGARLTFEKRIILPIVFGGTVVHDGNQYLGAKDDDEDGVPNQWDMFPDKNDAGHISWLQGLLTPTQISELINSGDLPDINNPSPNIADLEAPMTEWGVDVGIPLIRTKILNLWTYAQMAQIVDYGKGLTVPGVKLNIGPVHALAEYRIFDAEFMPDFFDMAYETQRVTWDEALGTYVTKKERLVGIPSAQGYFAEAGVNVFNLLDITAAYQNMAYDGGLPGQSFYAQATLLTKAIPKLEKAEAYFQQPNVDKLFDEYSDGTVMGYRIGIGMGGGVMIIYDNKTIYYNGEPNRIMTIETAISF